MTLPKCVLCGKRAEVEVFDARDKTRPPTPVCDHCHSDYYRLNTFRRLR